MLSIIYDTECLCFEETKCIKKIKSISLIHQGIMWTIVGLSWISAYMSNTVQHVSDCKMLQYYKLHNENIYITNIFNYKYYRTHPERHFHSHFGQEYVHTVKQPCLILALAEILNLFRF